MRKLVTVQKIFSLDPIPGADFIELASVMGWKAVVKKGDFSVGDKCLYFEVDSFLPIEEQYEFLRASSYRKNEYMGEGFRIKTMRLKGFLSQGLIMPFNNSIDAALPIGSDLTESLGVKKWFIPEIEGSAGISIGRKPFGIPTTDEIRVQSATDFIEAIKGKPYYISTKMDGTSMTVYCKDDQAGVCGRNEEYKDTDASGYWKCACRYDLPAKLLKLGRNLAIQGEYCGAGIQKNRLNLLEPKFYIFDIVDLDTNEYLDYFEMRDIVYDLDLDMVPIEELADNFNYTLEDLLAKSKGKYASGKNKEGIVVRSIPCNYNVELGNRLSFKVINDDFLLKEEK